MPVTKNARNTLTAVDFLSRFGGVKKEIGVIFITKSPPL